MKAASILIAGLLALAPAMAATQAQDPMAVVNDYPTAARADYVFGCMAANGQTRRALEQCSCSVDVVATILPYESYVEAEAVLRLRQVGGEKTTVFRSSELAKTVVADLRRAQAEAEIRCFE